MAEQFELHLERHLAAAYDSVEAALHEGPKRWLPGFRSAGERQTAELAYSEAGGRIARRIDVDVGPVQRFAYGVTVHVSWRAAQRAELYPELDGHLRAEPSEPSGTTLRFDARYVPPAGRLGATVDRALMHRVAQSSIDDFVDRVARLLAAH